MTKIVQNALHIFSAGPFALNQENTKDIKTKHFES